MDKNDKLCKPYNGYSNYYTWAAYNFIADNDSLFEKIQTKAIETMCDVDEVAKRLFCMGWYAVSEFCEFGEVTTLEEFEMVNWKQIAEKIIGD